MSISMKERLGTMQTVYEAAGGRDGLLRLASAWHTRVLKDEAVSHAFSHGYHAQHTERLAAYWRGGKSKTTQSPQVLKDGPDITLSLEEKLFLTRQSESQFKRRSLYETSVERSK